VIYIPAVSKLDDQTKMSGPSPLRELINSVLKSVLETSPVYENFRSAFESFRGAMKTEKSADGSSLGDVERDVSDSLRSWGTSFKLDVRNIDPEAILRSLIEPSVVDPASGAMPPDHFGHGLQRHLIYSLLLLASRPSSKERSEPKSPRKQKKEFAPDFTWLLFEEPEAFLHPTQTDALDRGLRQHANQQKQQVLITTHSTRFASRSMADLSSLVRLERSAGVTSAGQLQRERLQEVLASNQAIASEIRSASEALGPGEAEIEMESIKYALWLDPARTSAFFAARVFLVEGPTERAAFQYLVETGRLTVPEGGLVFLDTFGKWNIHRFISLMSGLRIPHVVLHDRDGSSKSAPAWAKRIEDSRTGFTRAIDTFESDFEGFLGIPKPPRPPNKAQSAVWHLLSDKVERSRLDALCAKVQALIDGMA
jgi:putative ATP-dependent endonuclease of the OLD family